MKKGFTLIELLVTILISSFAIALAGYVYVSAFKSDLSTRFKLRSMDDANKLMSVVLEDIGRMGNHSSLVQGDTSRINLSRLFWDLSNSDSSQFQFINHDSTDQFIFKTLRYNSLGKIIGYDSVQYSINNGTLSRKLNFIDTAGTVSTDTSVILADSVQAFDLRLGQMANLSSASLYSMSSSSAFVLRVDSANPVSASISGFNVRAGATYQVRFNESADTSVSYNWDQLNDSLSVSLVASGGTSISGVHPKYIYPNGGVIAHQIQFSPSVDVNGASFEFKLKKKITPTFTSVDTIRNVEITETSAGQYQWLSGLSSSSTGVQQKRNTQALEIRLVVSIKGKTTQVTRIVPLPANQ